MTPRGIVFGTLLAACSAAAQAALTCDQLNVVAQTTIRLRDEGSSLSRVMAEVERSGVRDKFTPEEVNAIRQAVRLVYTSEVSVTELVESCTERNKPRD